MLIACLVGFSANGAEIWLRGVFLTSAQLPFHGLVLDTDTGEFSWVNLHEQNVAEVELEDGNRAPLASVAHRIENSGTDVSPKMIRNVVGRPSEYAVLDGSGDVWLVTDTGQNAPLQFKLLNLAGALKHPHLGIIGGTLAGETTILIRNDHGEMAAAIISNHGTSSVKTLPPAPTESNSSANFSTTRGDIFQMYRRTLRCGDKLEVLGQSEPLDPKNL